MGEDHLEELFSEKIKRVEDKVATVAKQTSELWAQFNSFREDSRTRDDKLREAVVKVNMDAKELGDSIADKIESRLKREAGTLTKVIEWAFKAGMVVGVLWIGANQAHAAIIL